MTERPILMSAPMVRAILAGTKTQTRRVCKLGVRAGMPEPELASLLSCCPYGQPGDGWREASGIQVHERGAGTHPLGRGTRALQPETGGPCAGCGTVVDSRNRVGGSRLWVRETYFAWGRWETRFSAKKGRDEWHFVDMTLEAGKSYAYAADGLPAGYAKHHAGRGGVTPTWWKRPAIFMPRAACRLALEVTGVRVERLQDISEADCIAEGCTQNHNGYFWGGPHAVSGLKQMATARQAYRDLWESINGPESWSANQWVWAVEFKRIEGAA